MLKARYIAVSLGAFIACASCADRSRDVRSGPLPNEDIQAYIREDLLEEIEKAEFIDISLKNIKEQAALNHVAASSKYEGMKVVISGVVTDVSDNGDGLTASISIGDRLDDGVFCSPILRAQVGGLVTGESTVRVRGVISRVDSFDGAKLGPCEILNK